MTITVTEHLFSRNIRRIRWKEAKSETEHAAKVL
jgi:hypothetical protein